MDSLSADRSPPAKWRALGWLAIRRRLPGRQFAIAGELLLKVDGEPLDPDAEEPFVLRAAELAPEGCEVEIGTIRGIPLYDGDLEGPEDDSRNRPGGGRTGGGRSGGRGGGGRR